MIDKRFDRNYNHSHEKSVKSCEKHLTRNKESGKIHSLTASQPHSLTASQLRANCAQIKLHSNTYDFFQPITCLRQNVCSTLRLRRFFINLQTNILYKEII